MSLEDLIPFIPAEQARPCFPAPLTLLSRGSGNLVNALHCIQQIPAPSRRVGGISSNLVDPLKRSPLSRGRKVLFTCAGTQGAGNYGGIRMASRLSTELAIDQHPAPCT